MKFQLGHFLAEMDRRSFVRSLRRLRIKFQLGHFLAEMDRNLVLNGGRKVAKFQLGHFLAEMDRSGER